MRPNREKSGIQMKTIGITGGVGAGKSTVLGFLETDFQAVVCEADKVAHKLQEPGEVCYEEIIEEFGCGILDGDGKIDRKKLGNIVFADEKKLQRLNRIVHPRVKEYIRKKKEEEKDKQSKEEIKEKLKIFITRYQAKEAKEQIQYYRKGKISEEERNILKEMEIRIDQLDFDEAEILMKRWEGME